MCVDIFSVHTNANLYSDGVEYWGIMMRLSTGCGVKTWLKTCLCVMLTIIVGGRHGGGGGRLQKFELCRRSRKFEWYVDHVMKTYCQPVFVASFGHVTSIYVVGFHVDFTFAHIPPSTSISFLWDNYDAARGLRCSKENCKIWTGRKSICESFFQTTMTHVINVLSSFPVVKQEHVEGDTGCIGCPHLFIGIPSVMVAIANFWSRWWLRFAHGIGHTE